MGKINPPRRFSLPVQSRKCSGCTACCVWLNIRELNKPEGVPCQYINSNGDGCSQHVKKPCGSAGDFVCEWLAGNIAYQYRPNRIGLMFRRDFDNAIYAGLLICDELVENAHATREGATALAQIAATELVYIRIRTPDGQLGKRRIIGPEHLLEQLRCSFPELATLRV